MNRLALKLCSMALVLSLCITGCADSPKDDPMAAWLETANLTAAETPQQLYEAALKEDILVVYSTASRVLDTKRAFEAEYPGLAVEVRDIRSVDMLPMLRESHKKGEYLCDVVISQDYNKMLTDEFLPNGVVYRYCPPDIEASLLPGYNPDLLEFSGEGGILFYNSNVSKEPPVSNWWELTEPQWRGKICMISPLRASTASDFLCASFENSDEMAKAYAARYGKELAVPEGSSAAQEFWRMLLQNEVKLANSPDEVAEFVGTMGHTEPVLGFMVSSKLRLKKIGYEIAPIYEMEPICGSYTPNVISMAGYAKNINAAKLFIRFTMGETDGQGEGYKPFLQSGTWSVRSDVQSETPIPLNEMNFWRTDTDYISKNKEWILTLFTSLSEEQETVQ